MTEWEVTGSATETTGDITTLTDSTTSHWGSESTFDVEHPVQAHSPHSNNHYHLLSEDSDDDNSEVSTPEPAEAVLDSSTEEDSGDESDEDPSGNNYGVKNLMRDIPNEGSQFSDGVRRSTRRRGQNADLALSSSFSVAEHMFTAFKDSRLCERI